MAIPAIEVGAAVWSFVLQSSGLPRYCYSAINAIALTVRSSAKAKTIEEAQQRAVFLIFPLLALVIGQFTGIILISTWLLLGFGVVLVILDVLLMKGVAKNFTYEKLLR